MYIISVQCIPHGLQGQEHPFLSYVKVPLYLLQNLYTGLSPSLTSQRKPRGRMKALKIQEEHGERAFSIWRSNEAPKKEAVTFLESAPGSLTSGPHSRKRGHILTWRSIFASELLMFHLYNLPHTQEEEGN